MKDNLMLNDKIKPLLDIDNDLFEMSKCLKIITSLKNDIVDIIEKKPKIDKINNNYKLNLEDKYNKIKKQIQKFMNIKNYLYNFLRNENNSSINNENEENEKLLEENKKENAMSKVNKMQNELENLVKLVEQILSKEELSNKKEPLIEEINKNEINNIYQNNNNEKLVTQKSISSTKAYIYNEETKELEKISKTIEGIKKGNNDMKIFIEEQGNNIDFTTNQQKTIIVNLDKGINELSEAKEREKQKNKKNLICIGCLILLIIITAYIIYNKIK